MWVAAVCWCGLLPAACCNVGVGPSSSLSPRCKCYRCYLIERERFERERERERETASKDESNSLSKETLKQGNSRYLISFVLIRIEQRHDVTTKAKMTTSAKNEESSILASSASKINDNDQDERQAAHESKVQEQDDDDDDGDKKPAAKQYPEYDITNQGEKDGDDLSGDDHSEDKNDNDNDDDDSKSSSNSMSSSSSSHGDQDDEEDDKDNDNNDDTGNDDGLSAYEKLRLARIKRNQEYLAKLGLDEDNRQKNRPSTVKRQRRVSTESAATTERRSTLSRQSKRDVKYTDFYDPTVAAALDKSKTKKNKDQNHRRSVTEGDTTMTSNADATIPSLPLLPPPGISTTGPRKERTRSYRMDRVIYDEFKRIKSVQKQNVISCKRLVRQAGRHVKYWYKRASQWTKRYQAQVIEEQRHLARQLHLARVQQQQVYERQVLAGPTCVELLDELDRHKPLMFRLVHEYELEQKVRYLSVVGCCESQDRCACL
jgi:hypothetical protein